MGVTIKDIAERAGVSAMTVSRVMNNSGYVSAATREAVEAAVKELGYHPNLLARGLINKKSSFIYVIVPDISNPFYADLTKGAERIARASGYSIILSNAYRDKSLEVQHIEAARGRMAEGIILVLPELSEKMIEEYSSNTPLVVVDKYIRSRNIDRIYIHQEAGAFAAAEHLIKLGHRRIAFLSGSRKIYNSRSRQRGYEQALQQYGIPADPSLVFSGDFSFESGERAFSSYIKLDPSVRPTALFAASDLMALGFMRRAFLNGCSIPEEISVVGFDDISIASITHPQLTTVRHPFIEMGEEAMKHLLRKLNGGNPVDHDRELKNTLIVRETTSKV